MVSQQTGLPLLQCLHRMGRQFSGAEGGIGSTANVVTTSHRCHVVERWNPPVMAGQSGCMNGMAMQHRHGIGPISEDIGMQSPLRRGSAVMAREPAWQRLAAKINCYQILRLHLVVGQRARGHQQSPLNPQRQVAGCALIQAAAVHGTGHAHELTAQRPIVHRYPGISHGCRAPSVQLHWQSPHHGR